MGYEWDSRKAARNLHKHGVDFADAVTAFEDELALTLDDDYLDEQRFITIGSDARGQILVVIYTFRGENIRIISAREATPRERRQYTEGI
ncbi:MAG: BrnT family toxin [Acidobacteria bacterium]|nr:BrnT family toxin [Acidobacteriota bacterium]